MSQQRSVAIVAEVVDHDHDHWCVSCRLSTGVRAVVMTDANGVAQLHEVLFCPECGGQDVVVDAEPRRCSGEG